MRDNTGRFIATHNEAGTRLYNIWSDMKRRCCSKKRKDYPRYGGRGIIVYRKWNDNFITFRDWALSHGYTDELSIDRINNDGNYEPSNCQWLPLKENHLKDAIKSVNQFDLRGNIVATFTSMSEAERQTGAKQGHISEICNGRGRRKTENGYLWEYI